MAVDVGHALAYLDLDTSKFHTGLKTAASDLNTFLNSTKSVDTRISSLANVATSTGKAMTVGLTLPLTAVGTIATKSAVTFESAFTGVRKTVDATSETYDILSDNIKKMATETASSSAEIAGVMEVAGQLGVEVGESGKAITKFTKIMVELGDTTNLSAEEAATSLAQFMNIMGTSNDDVDRLGSSIVDLGNNFATTERDVVNMSLRLASAGKISGLTEQEILALATAMSSVGIEAEAGGTAMAQTLAAIESAVASGGDKLSEFARIANMSTAEFTSAWQSTPMEALQAFIKGLGGLADQGENATLVLDDLGLSGIRQSNMLKALALSSNNMTDALATSNEAWEQNTALTEEAEKRYGTTESKLKQLKESFNNVAIEIGEILLPFLQKLVDTLQKMIDGWNALPDGMQKAIVYIGLVVAAIGPLLTAFGSLLKMYLEIKTLGGLAGILSVGSAASTIGSTTTALGGLAAGIGGASKAATAAKGALASAGTVLSTVGSAALTTGAALATFDTIKNPVINALGKITGETEKAELMLERYGYAGDTFRMIGDTVELVANKFQGLPPIMNGVENQYIALEDAINKVNDGYIYSDEQLDKMREKWNFSAEDIETLRQGMIDAHPEIVELTDNFVDLNDASMETLQQVSKGLQAMSENGKTVDDVLSGNVKGVKNLTQQASSFFNQMKNDTVTVVTAVGEVEKKITDQSGKMTETGKNIVKGLKEGIESEKSTAVNSAVSISNDLASALDTSKDKAKKSGKNVVAGLNEGIIQSKDTTAKVVTDWIDTVPNTMHKQLDEHSPSKLSEKSAINVVKGFNSGIDSESSTTKDTVSSWMELLVKTFNSSNYSIYMNNVGSGIVNSILKGMQNAWNNVTSWFNSSISGLSNQSGYSSAMRIAGSYANGLDYVPYNNYIASLHEGERVLTKQENEAYNKGTQGNVIQCTFYSPEAIDEYKAAELLKRTIKELDL